MHRPPTATPAVPAVGGPGEEKPGAERSGRLPKGGNRRAGREGGRAVPRTHGAHPPSGERELLRKAPASRRTPRRRGGGACRPPTGSAPAKWCGAQPRLRGAPGDRPGPGAARPRSMRRTAYKRRQEPKWRHGAVVSRPLARRSPEGHPSPVVEAPARDRAGREPRRARGRTGRKCATAARLEHGERRGEVRASAGRADPRRVLWAGAPRRGVGRRTAHSPANASGGAEKGGAHTAPPGRPPGDVAAWGGDGGARRRVGGGVRATGRRGRRWPTQAMQEGGGVSGAGRASRPDCASEPHRPGQCAGRP